MWHHDTRIRMRFCLIVLYFLPLTSRLDGVSEKRLRLLNLIVLKRLQVVKVAELNDDIVSGRP
jgi:hypothetical protein